MRTHLIGFYRDSYERLIGSNLIDLNLFQLRCILSRKKKNIQERDCIMRRTQMNKIYQTRV